MEAHQTISLSKTFVPNSYVVSLAPSDYAQVEQYRRSLEQELAEAVLGAARDRSYTLLAFPSVEIERGEDLPPGDLRVSCALVDAPGPLHAVRPAEHQRDAREWPARLGDRAHRRGPHRDRRSRAPLPHRRITAGWSSRSRSCYGACASASSCSSTGS